MYDRDKIMKVLREIVTDSEGIKPYVVIAQPRRNLEETPAQNFDGYGGIHVDFSGFSRAFCNIGGEKVDVARNYLIEQVLESGAKYMFFAGEDTVVPSDGFLNLLKIAEANPDAMVVGVYYMKISVPMIMVEDGDWVIPALNVDPGQIIEACQTGLDCALIPVSLLEAMKTEDPEIPFCCIANDIEGIPFVGEDNFFVHRFRKLGYKILVNTDVQCLHMDLKSGKYTAHPDVNLNNYFTNEDVPITTPLTIEDKLYIDKRWMDRLPKGSNVVEE